MPEQRHWYLFMYDIADDKRLRVVHKVLSSWAKPLQYSIFYARLTKRELERVRYEISEQMEPEHDRLAVVRLCNGCASRVKVHGDELAPLSELSDEPPPFTIV